MVKINNLDDLYNLISDQVKEKFDIDYRPADALEKTYEKERDIAKDISAFANSGGGIIIYGIKEHNESKQKIINPIDGLNFSKGWLKNVIETNVFPRLEDFCIQSIPLSFSDNDVVYVVIINKSYTVLQASDYRYYTRYNFKSVPMCDFEIRSIINQTHKRMCDLEIEHSDYKVKPMFPTLQLSINQKQSTAEKKETKNIPYVYGSDIDEYMEIMLTSI